MTEHVLTNSSLKAHIMILRIVFDQAIKRGIIAANPVSDLQVTDRADRTEPWLPDELRGFFRAILDRLPYPTAYRDLAAFLIMIECGPRAEETTNIDLDDWDQATARITITHGKGRKRRTLGVSPTTQSILEYYTRNIRPTFKPKDKALFVNRNGKRLTYSNLRKQMQSYRAQGQAPSSRTLHGFRVTFAINHYLQHRDAIALKLALGHASFDMVWHYIRIAEEQISAELNSRSTWLHELIPDLEQLGLEASQSTAVATLSVISTPTPVPDIVVEKNMSMDNKLIGVILSDDRLTDAVKVDLLKGIYTVGR